MITIAAVPAVPAVPAVLAVLGSPAVPAGVVDGVALALLAAVLAQPASARLASARWPDRAPRAALTLWIAIGLACGLAGVGSLLSLGLAPLGSHLLPNLARLATSLATGHDPLPAWAWTTVAAGLTLLAWQFGVLGRCVASVAASRRVHRDLLDVVGTWEEDLGTVVLEDARLLAYHLPGLRDSRVVVTRGCVDGAGPGELTAVLAHERAHARGHHHVVVQAFVAWQRTFPFIRAAASAITAVALLTEQLADDAAVAQAGAGATVAALDHLGCAARTAARTADGRAAAVTAARIHRLGRDRPALGLPARALWYAVAGLVLVLPTALLART